MIKKQNREVCKQYLRFIRAHPCLVCGATPSQAHHTISRGAGGSDYTTIPLCVEHHIPGVHMDGKKTFQEKYNLDFDKEMIRLLIEYIKKEG